MNAKTLFVLVLAGFVVFCGWLVVESGFFANGAADGAGCVLLQTTAVEEPNRPATTADEPAQMTASEPVEFSMTSAPQQTVILGAKDPKTENPVTGFRFQLLLNTRGAAIARTTFSDGEGKGFSNLNPKNPEPLVILSPVRDVLSMASAEFVLDNYGQQLPLNKLSWESLGVDTDANGIQTARFQAVIRKKAGQEPFLKLTKSYKVTPGSFLVECSLHAENLSGSDEKIHFDMLGPVGIDMEASKSDQRKAMAAYTNAKGQIETERIDITKFSSKEAYEARPLSASGEFLWAAITNKYFAAVLVPVPEDTKSVTDWIADKYARFYNAERVKNSEAHNVGISVRTTSAVLAAAGSAESGREYKFNLYIGPKEKRIFDSNEYYRALGFVQTIDFRTCCCPAGLISPLAFGILSLMEWMYKFIPNYGVVIIILVFVVRLILHPLTKKSQVSMSRMSKLGPRAEEIKKKYAGNKQEMNKHLMELYREQGASPIMGMLPMFAQMPIWIALWSAIYTGIALRGASLDPWWITDLSAPDAIFTFPRPLPLVGDSFNLLPILMGVAFWLQQKMTPQPAAAATSPQMAQQQKMMKIMMPLLFPVMLYNGPSGVNLYIMSSVFAGAIEQYVIRKHIERKEVEEAKGVVSATSKTGGKVKKKKPKPFFRTH